MSKSVLLTGINGTVAGAIEKQLSDEYDISGISVVRMDDVIRDLREPTWKEQLDAFNERVMEQLTTAIRGKTAVVHMGWNTRDENWQGGLDPLNITVVDCVYRAAIAERVPRIYMASSVHAYDFMSDPPGEDAEAISPLPDVREHAFGMPPTSLYGTSKRWMEIAGQYYVRHLHPEQKILVVRLGGISDHGKPGRRFSRLWNSHPDLAGLLRAFIECDAGAPAYWTAFGVSNNVGEPYSHPLFNFVNPYGFTPQDNAFERQDGV